MMPGGTYKLLFNFHRRTVFFALKKTNRRNNALKNFFLFRLLLFKLRTIVGFATTILFKKTVLITILNNKHIIIKRVLIKP